MSGSAGRHLVLAADAAFALPLAVTLRSALTHSDDSFDVTILHDAISQELRAKVEASAPLAGRSLTWVDAHDSGLDGPTGHLSPAAFFRLLVPQVVQGDGRVLYLDSDVVVCRPLDPLWEADLADRPLGAVRNLNSPYFGSWGGVRSWRAQGLPPLTPYFNSGFLLIDVERWRSQRISERALENRRSAPAGDDLDQDLLNTAVLGDWTELDPGWNQQTPIWDECSSAFLLYEEEVVEATRHDPRVVHFLDRPKPWHRDCTHPLRGLWRSVAGETAFAPVRLERNPVALEAKRRLRRAAVALVKGA